MSLNFNYENCGKDKAERDALMTHPGDPERWHPVGDALVWASLVCGYSKITTRNVDTVWKRVAIYQAFVGPLIRFNSGPVPLTRDDIVRYIGLSTNVTPKTDAQFAKDICSNLPKFTAARPAFDVIAEMFATKKVAA